MPSYLRVNYDKLVGGTLRALLQRIGLRDHCSYADCSFYVVAATAGLQYHHGYADRDMFKLRSRI